MVSAVELLLFILPLNLFSKEFSQKKIGDQQKKLNLKDNNEDPQRNGINTQRSKRTRVCGQLIVETSNYNNGVCINPFSGP